MTREELEAIAALDFDQPENVEIARKATIGGTDSLEWAMGVLAEGDAECARITAAEEEAVKRVRGRGAELRRRADQRCQYLRFAVEEYARTHRRELIPGKAKTAELLHGSIAYRSTAEKLEVENEAVALEWARAQPVESDLVRVKYEINRKALGEQFKRDGVIPPGCAVVPASESITIKPQSPETLDVAPSRKEITP